MQSKELETEQQKINHNVKKLNSTFSQIDQKSFISVCLSDNYQC